MSREYSKIEDPTCLPPDKLEVFLSSDQPTTCPHCGNRTEIVNVFDVSQYHQCLSEICCFQFILEFDEEDEL